MGHKELNHPLVGTLLLHSTTLLIADDPNLKLFVYTPLARENTAQKLAWLVGPTHTGAQIDLKETIGT